MLVIDPLGNHVSGVNTDSEGAVRETIAPLNALADQLDCLLVGVRHPNRSRRRQPRQRGPSGRVFRIEGVDAGHEEPITKATELGESDKTVAALLGSQTNSSRARDLILQLLEEKGEMESDQLDAEIARRTGLTARTVQKLRGELKDKGLIRRVPDKDKHGAISKWLVKRTNATDSRHSPAVRRTPRRDPQARGCKADHFVARATQSPMSER